MDLGSDLNDQSLAAEPALESALTNLLDNAVKARARRIEVSAQAQAHILEIRIRDNGAGLPAAALAAFNQGRPVSSTQGLGLGLLLGQAATERLGGSDSRTLPGQGPAEQGGHFRGRDEIPGCTKLARPGRVIT